MDPYSPFLTYRFDLAFHLASGLHHAQPRKLTNVPYIAHLMSVAALVLEAGGDEDQAIAALLHDAMEDQGGIPTLDTIGHLFGDRSPMSCANVPTANRRIPTRNYLGISVSKPILST